MILLRRLYAIWCLLWFLIPLLFFMPFFMIFHKREEWHEAIYYLNKLWAKIYFLFCFIPVEIERRFKPSKKHNYLYCANHSSYLDIIIMGMVVHQKHAFVGKESLTKIPVFGYMFRLLHIPVKRESKLEAYKAMLKMKAVLKEGKSLIVFPEGGIVTKNPPKMALLKDGAFRVAIETQTPIVPVTLPYNWFLLKDDNKFLPIRHKTKAIIHEPIDTTGLTLDDIPLLKKKFKEVIDLELDKYMPVFEKERRYRKHLSKKVH